MIHPIAVQEQCKAMIWQICCNFQLFKLIHQQLCLLTKFHYFLSKYIALSNSFFFFALETTCWVQCLQMPTILRSLSHTNPYCLEQPVHKCSFVIHALVLHHSCKLDFYSFIVTFGYKQLIIGTKLKQNDCTFIVINIFKKNF